MLSNKKITVRQKNPGPYVVDSGRDRKQRVAQFNRDTDERRKLMDAKSRQRLERLEQEASAAREQEEQDQLMIEQKQV